MFCFFPSSGSSLPPLSTHRPILPYMLWGTVMYWLRAALFFFNFFNWRVIALQNFVVFCWTSTWISHRCTYPLRLEPPLCNPMIYSPPGSSVHGIFQARVLECVAFPFSRGSSQTRDWTQVSYIGTWILYHLSYKIFPICPFTSSSALYIS